MPPYTNQNISSPVKCEVQLITQYKDQLRYSPTKEFTYLPNNNALKQECQSDEVTDLTSNDPHLTWIDLEISIQYDFNRLYPHHAIVKGGPIFDRRVTLVDYSLRVLCNFC